MDAQSTHPADNLDSLLGKSAFLNALEARKAYDNNFDYVDMDSLQDFDSDCSVCSSDSDIYGAAIPERVVPTRVVSILAGWPGILKS